MSSFFVYNGRTLQKIMKKFLSALALLLLLTACTDKWTAGHPDMPESLLTQLEQGIADNKATLEENPNDVDALFSMGFGYDQLGDYRKAVDYYKKVLAINPSHEVALNNIANIYEAVGEYEQAAEYIKQLYLLEQTNTETLKDTVRILLEANDPDHAQEALENFVIKNRETGETDATTAALISNLYTTINDYRTAYPDQQ